jgi:hypothetical protein
VKTNTGKYTPERVKRIIEALSAGNTRGASAAYGGIDHDTLNNWIKRHSEFSDAVKEAESKAEVSHVANIAKASRDGVWTASAWWLERRRHNEWGKIERMEHTGRDGGAIVFTINVGSSQLDDNDGYDNQD